MARCSKRACWASCAPIPEADLHLEGKFWLVHIEGEAFPAPADMAMATDVFEEGYRLPHSAGQVVRAGGQGAARLQAYEQGAAHHGQRHGLREEWAAVRGQPGWVPGARCFRQMPRREMTGLSFLSQDTQNYILNAF